MSEAKIALPFFSSKKPHLKSKAQHQREEFDKKRRAKMERVQRAIDLYQSGITKSQVARELGHSLSCINTWLKGITRPEGVVEQADPQHQALAENLSTVIADEALMASDKEKQDLLDVANNQNTPADRYQAYVAATGIRMLRDSMPHIRGPRTIKELSELDQLIRRNLGLNPKGSSGGSTLTIDVSILNNSKPTITREAVIVQPTQEETEEDEDGEDDD